MVWRRARSAPGATTACAMWAVLKPAPTVSASPSLCERDTMSDGRLPWVHSGGPKGGVAG